MNPQNKNTESELMLTDSELMFIDYNKVKQNDPDLRDLRLYNYNINSTAAIFIFKALTKNNIVDYVDLDSNQICDKAAPSIAYALENNKIIYGRKTQEKKRSETKENCRKGGKYKLFIK